jgi:membrane protein DedA with SNARE-associated domain
MTPDEPLTLFLACLVSGILVPLPEDVSLLVAGWQIQTGALAPEAALLAGVAGTLGRDLFAFGAGWVIGPRLERLPQVRRLLGEARIARAHALFGRYGPRMLFGTRFAVGLRAPLYFVGGSLTFPLRRFLLLDAIGLAITVPLTLWLGHRFGEDAAIALTAALGHQRLGLGAVLVGLVGWLLVQRARRRARRAVESE